MYDGEVDAPSRTMHSGVRVCDLAFSGADVNLISDLGRSSLSRPTPMYLLTRIISEPSTMKVDTGSRLSERARTCKGQPSGSYRAGRREASARACLQWVYNRVRGSDRREATLNYHDCCVGALMIQAYRTAPHVYASG